MAMSKEHLAAIEARVNLKGCACRGQICAAHSQLEQQDVPDLIAELLDIHAQAVASEQGRQRAEAELNRFLCELLDLLPGADERGADAYDQIPRGIEALRAERDRLRQRAEQAEAEQDRLAERERYLQETADAAMSGWKKAEVDLAEMRTIATEQSEACGKAGAERDRLAKQPAVSMDDLARAISSGDVQINHGDYPAWDDLAGSGRDAYRQLARHLLATFRILGALDGDDREEASDG